MPARGTQIYTRSPRPPLRPHRQNGGPHRAAPEASALRQRRRHRLPQGGGTRFGLFCFSQLRLPGCLFRLSPLIAFLRATATSNTLAPLKLFKSLRPFALQHFTTSPAHIYIDASNAQLGVDFPDHTAAMVVFFIARDDMYLQIPY